MKTTHFRPAHFTPILIAIAALIGACSSMPKTTSLLDQTRSDYAVASNDSRVTTYAPQEFKLASDAMDSANNAANHNESSDNIDKLAYLAKQKIALSQEVAKQKSAEANVAGSAEQRDRMRLEQRTVEADQARLTAEQAKQAALAAQSDSAVAQRKMENAQDAAATAQRDTQEAQARAAKLEAQLADLAAKKTARGMVIVFGDLLFGTDLARLNADGVRSAQKLADVLQQNPQRTVLIEGFTDSTGSNAHNQALSERRTNAVSRALQEAGIAPSRIAQRGYGESYPTAGNDTANNRQLNRRAEIILSDENGQIPTR